ncbi:Fe-S cluster assembly protein HesB [Acrocarpospora catenulata]|uniref:Fe-S cluster assembly protein HesB n=1 Tax=Acrocarpospora catenulata TaxID=2836182 RepID=UPI001BDB6A5C|nr:Fe-S cluster assembly protein HesB [Acrocarpospora catenulata]
MLTLTDNAVQVIRDLTAQATESGETGIRIAGQADEPGALLLSVAEAPAATDQVIDVEGARVFLDSEAADVLDDKSLDASVDDQGGVSFRIEQQRFM